MFGPRKIWQPCCGRQRFLAPDANFKPHGMSNYVGPVNARKKDVNRYIHRYILRASSLVFL
jgi:hypothetical protein